MTHRGLVLAFALPLALGACGPAHRDNNGDGGGSGGVDNDHDGFTDVGGDCNDADPAINPGATEACDDGIDNNCNSYIDHGDPVCMTPCEKAAFDRSSVGCIYYGIDTNTLGGPYAMSVSNIDPGRTANVVVEQKQSSGGWAAIAGGSFSVPPRSLQTVTPPRAAVDGSTMAVNGVYRITSDLPVIAYQFAPIDGSASYLSDASLLLPASALDKYYIVPAWPRGAADQGSPADGWPANIQITPIDGGATVTVTSTTATAAGGVPALTPGVPQAFDIAEGDYLQLTVAAFEGNFEGTYIEATAPVAVFTSNNCANVPDSTAACCCEHLEEQVFGLQTWGTDYVAAQMPRRTSESSFWHILAQQDGTNLTFDATSGVTGLPGPTIVNARQVLTLEVSGGPATGADFFVHSDKPIHVNQFTVGTFYAGAGTLGDPDMIQAIPTAQYLQSYVILVPGTWVYDFLVLTRKTGASVLVDGVAVTTGWTPVGASGYEATRYPVPDGVHVVDGSEPFGVSVSGYDDYDSYSYPGGLNQTVINPIE